MSVRWGLLSTARINDSILAAAAHSDIVEIVAVASRQKDGAEAYARQHGIARAHGSYQALIDDPAVEVVYISLPNALHVDWAVRALRAGKHVLCEKPLTRWARGAMSAFAAAHESGRILAEGFMYRHHPQTQRLAALIAEGAVGRVKVLRASLSFDLQGEDIRLSSALEGGAMMDLGCYCVSSLRLVGGEPDAVQGMQITTGDGVDTRFVGTLLFPDEIIGQFDVAMTMPLRSRLEIVGSGGSIVVDDPWVCKTPGIDLTRGGRTERIAIAAVDHYRLEIEDMSRAVLGLGAPLLGRADALGQARAIEALYTAAAAGRTVALAEIDP